MVNIVKEKILDNFTIECPECGYTLFGDEPRYIIECNVCLEKKKSKFISNEMHGSKTTLMVQSDQVEV